MPFRPGLCSIYWASSGVARKLDSVPETVRSVWENTSRRKTVERAGRET
jgi:hypothetical protein